MSLFEELTELKSKDKKIVKSFKPKDELSPQIFEGDKMREDIRKRLLEIADDFIDSFGVEFFIHDIILTGSLANYNWSNFSDVDIHILIDYKESDYRFELVKEFFDAKKSVFNEKHKIQIKGYDVEVYVQDIDEPHISSGVYSILHDKWLLKPKPETPNIDDRKILEKAEEYAKKIDDLLKMKNVDGVLLKIDELRKKIKEFRQSGLESGGEYSYENLVYKLLRRNGYIEKLLKLKTYITDKKLSLTQ